jgi:hypothetical protein
VSLGQSRADSPGHFESPGQTLHSPAAAVVVECLVDRVDAALEVVDLSLASSSGN